MTRSLTAFLPRATALREGALRLAAVLGLMALAACATPPPGPDAHLSPAVKQMYGPLQDGEFLIPAVPPQYLNEQTIRQEVTYWSDEKPGTIVVDPWTKHLYLIQPDNRAIRYGVAVGKDDFQARDRGVVFAERRVAKAPIKRIADDRPP